MQGTEHAEAIFLELPEPEEAYFSPRAFEKMKKLWLLVLVNVDKDNSFPDSIRLPNALMWFQWPNCPLVPEFSKGPKKLVGLDMRKSKIKVPEQFKDFKKLKFINYSECESPIHMPDLKCIPDLEELDLHGCKNLEHAHESLADHNNLQLLNLSGCSKLHDFPKMLRSKKLQLLNLNLCSKLESFPEIPDKMEGLRGLYLIKTSIEKLPKSIENLVSLEEMDLRYCTKLRILPSSIYRFQNLERLILEGCSGLVEFPKNGEDPKDPHMKTGFPKLYVLNLRGCNLSKVDFLESSCFPVLRALYLLGNNFATLPTCGQLHNLLWLDVSHTQQLQEIPKMPGQLRRLYAIGCESLSKFPPDTFEVQGISSQNRLPSYSTSRRDASIFAP
ncbi:disease resistance protein RPP2B-like [Rhodamnia argentea]|uniref:Disease resistance protein RPP2B-like n=1 Tax=Rhodamnia argentea TaxID=178133 RepID=A0ABM3H891_9MYRT|nr:disease resistance protein RPP2B-like [Rhodamnia argentea]